MGKRSPAPPPTPDYAAIARQQGQENIEAARQSAYMSNPNVYTPTASQTVTWQKTPQFNQTAYDKAMEEFKAKSAAGVEGVAEPLRETFTSYVEQPTVRQELTGEAKNIFDIQQQAEKAMATLGQRELGDLSQYLNKDFLAALSPILTGYGDYGTTGAPPNLAAIGKAGGVAAGTGGAIEGAPSAAGYAPTRSFAGPALQGEFAPTGTAGSAVQAFGTPDYYGVGQGYAYGNLGGFGQVSGAPNITGMGQAGTGGMAAGAGLPGQVDFGQFGSARANVTPFGVTGGPQAGMFGMAAGGPQAANLGQLNLGGVSGVTGAPGAGQFGTAGGGPAAGLYGFAAGGPGAVQFGGLDTSGLQGVQGGIGQFGTRKAALPVSRLAGLTPAASVNLAQRRLTISLAAPLAALPRRR